MSTAVHALSGQHLVLYSIAWPTYVSLLRAFGDRPALRLTYDRGTLELMTLSPEHESLSYLLSRLVDALTEELGLPVKGGGSTTFRRRLRRRGLEPDGCWWITNEALVRGKTKIDLRRDPPPDLALEIDITRSSLNRLAIYAALRVPEVWQYANQSLVCHLLGKNGRYSTSATSQVFPGLAVADLDRFLSLRGQMDDNAIVRQFRAWVRQQFGPQISAQTVP
jgi:Uma2 family endonuclease